MKILVFGANGFFGRNIVQALSPYHEVHGAVRSPASAHEHYADLAKPETITKILEQVRPDAIVNGAGIIENNESASLNPVFTSNLLEAVASSRQKFRHIIISGSAAEYGVVRPEDLPVKEMAPLNATSPYGLSKVKETTLALRLRDQYNLPVVIARVFNPLGPGMGPRFLISGILRQVKEIKAGTRGAIEVSRLDSSRDCLHIQDVASAVRLLVEHDPNEEVYNIGSGKSTSNAHLIELILNYSKLASSPKIIETSPEPEPLMAVQADITRLTAEFGWSPRYDIDETVKEIVDEAD